MIVPQQDFEPHCLAPWWYALPAPAAALAVATGTPAWTQFALDPVWIIKEYQGGRQPEHTTRWGCRPG